MAAEPSRLDFSRLRTYPLATRQHKVTASSFADLQAWRRSGRLSSLFPRILKGSELRDFVSTWRQARSAGKPVLVGLGAHVIKCGLSPLLIDLLRRGLISGLAMNGAGIVHDYELALIGATSEEVADEIGAGRFGMAEETAAGINAAIAAAELAPAPAAGVAVDLGAGMGLGEALGRAILAGQLPCRHLSLLAACAELRLPCTVHVAFGTDIYHMHPATDGARLGALTLNDFRRLTEQVARLDGGIYCNVGSAVILPEVFIKALSLARNLGAEVRRPITANFDMLRHYRPEVNVLLRPTLDGGRSFQFIGHHELMLPLLYTMLLEDEE